MCEFFLELKVSDWVDVIQMLIAGFSALLLFLAFIIQQKNYKSQLEISKLEKRAKRAMFLPQIEENCFINTQDEIMLGWDTRRDDQIYTFRVEFKVVDSSIKIESCDIVSSFPEIIEYEITQKIDDAIFTKNDVFKFNFKYNRKKFNEKITVDNEREIYVNLVFEDMIGHRYKLVLLFIGEKSFRQPLVLL